MKILAITACREDASSLYRGWGVLAEMARTYPDITVDYATSLETGAAKAYDAFFLLRPDDVGAVNIARVAKQMKRKLIVDYDDNLVDIPEFNPYVKLRRSERCDYRSNIIECMRLADIVTVSTKVLQAQLSEYAPRVTCIENCFDDFMYDAKSEFNHGSDIVLWRGGNSHMRDLYLFKDAYMQVIQANPDFRFVFWCEEIPAWLSEFSLGVDNVEFKDYVSAYSYLNHLSIMEPSLLLVPLENIEFNHAKSSCAKIEAVAAGALTLAPDFVEWRWNTPSSLLYKDVSDFGDKANSAIKMIRDGGDVDKVYEKEIRFIHDHRLLSQANEKRVKLYRGV